MGAGRRLTSALLGFLILLILTILVFAAFVFSVLVSTPAAFAAFGVASAAASLAVAVVGPWARLRAAPEPARAIPAAIAPRAAFTSKMALFATSIAANTKFSTVVLRILPPLGIILQLHFHWLAEHLLVVESTSWFTYFWTASSPFSPFWYSTKAKQYSPFLLLLTVTLSRAPYFSKRSVRSFSSSFSFAYFSLFLYCPLQIRHKQLVLFAPILGLGPASAGAPRLIRAHFSFKILLISPLSLPQNTPLTRE